MPKLLTQLRAYYKAHGRVHLPWRHTRDPYKILVSEVMLQQTQVARVVPKYQQFIKAFPTWEALAQAPLAQVLREWQGLGYNRRGKYLHDAAKIVARVGWHGQKLPGVGPYTAAAVEAFAYNKPTIFIETNIRTVFLYHLRSSALQKTAIADSELLPLVGQALKKSHMLPRDFYAALMDYGSYLKSQGVRLNARSKHYTKQKKFEGSARQLRGALLRMLLAKPATLAEIKKDLAPRKGSEVERALKRLAAEGLLVRKGGEYQAA